MLLVSATVMLPTSHSHADSIVNCYFKGAPLVSTARVRFVSEKMVRTVALKNMFDCMLQGKHMHPVPTDPTFKWFV